MQCPRCGGFIPDAANYCPQCGLDLAPYKAPVRSDADGSPAPAGRGWGAFFLTLALSLALTLVLSLVFGFPVLILGAVLPLFWFGRRR